MRPVLGGDCRTLCRKCSPLQEALKDTSFVLYSKVIKDLNEFLSTWRHRGTFTETENTGSSSAGDKTR